MFLKISPYVFNTKLTWYSICILVGALITLVITNYFYKKSEESKKCPDLIYNTFLLAFPSGLLGARIWFVLSELDYYLNDPISILKVWEGGLAIQGGVILGAAVGIYYVYHSIRKFNLNLKVVDVMDMAIPNILIAQVIGRWGNFFNREVYGACMSSVEAGRKLWFLPNFISDYLMGGVISGQYIDCASNEYATPLFLYEGVLNLIGFILITIVLRKLLQGKLSGKLSAFYLIWYGVVRFSLEGLRHEEFIMRWGKFSQSKITSLVYIALGVAFLIYLLIQEKKATCSCCDDKKCCCKEEVKNEEDTTKEVKVKKTVAKKVVSKKVTTKKSNAKKENNNE